MTDRAKYTISVGIANLVAASSFTPNWGMLFAACIIVMIPCIVLYCFFQRNISEGMTSGAVKG